MTFRVGQKVVLVGWNQYGVDTWKSEHADARYPNVGDVYTVREIKPWRDTAVLLLQEIHNSHLGYEPEPGFRQEFFRPAVEPVRAKLIASRIPYVIENVPEAPIRADLMLCANMFGLRSYRHRHFECSFPIDQPPHPEHKVRVNRRGENRREHWANGGFITITGDVGTYCGSEAMGIDWMSGAEMSEAIPPAYAEYIGRKALAISHPMPAMQVQLLERQAAGEQFYLKSEAAE